MMIPLGSIGGLQVSTIEVNLGVPARLDTGPGAIQEVVKISCILIISHYFLLLSEH